MEIFCTYCSKEKDELIDYLPAIHRYKSKRIRKINESAKSLGFPMFILSGKYGLISAEKKIRYYDHLLLEIEVDDLVNKNIVKQLRKNKIEKIYFFRNPSNQNIKPYVRAIINACKLTKTKIAFLEIDIGEIENVADNGFREIWYAALKANQKMVIDEDLSALSFASLFEKYPNDGMLFYERAEAFECLGDPKKAKSDYEHALLFFPNPKWKKVAYEGLKRIPSSTGKNKKRGVLDLRWNYFHQINSFVYIPNEIRVFVLSALERYEEERRLATGELRVCLEMLVYDLSKKYKTINQNFFLDVDFYKKIDNLKNKMDCDDIELRSKMKNCWKWMSEIIHPIKYLTIPEEYYKKSLESYIRILEICNNKKLLSLE